MRVVYYCMGCDREVEFNGHPMTWGRYIHGKKNDCCKRSWMIKSWGWPNGNDV